jgi:hypothetical protein
MLKILSAQSREPWDPDEMVRGIMGQLDLEGGLLKNSAGLLFCHTEFIKSGAAAALCKSLPFETMGCSSQCFALSGAEDEILLSLTVLSSDDTEFAPVLSEPVTEDAEARVEAAYRKAAASLSAAPALIFSLQPALAGPGGDVILSALDRAAGGIPIFGGCAMDADINIRDPVTIFRGAAYPDRAALLLMAGPLKPRFFSALCPGKTIYSQASVITGVRDNLILSIDNLPVPVFLKRLGILKNNIPGILPAIPLIVDYGGGSKPETLIARGLSPEGALVCSRKVRAGATLNLAAISAQFVLESAAALCGNIMAAGDGEPAPSVMFAFSCFSRNMTLGDPMEEIGEVQRGLKNFPAPYVFCYSCGEICPQDTAAGERVNQFHQYALTACLL